MVKSPNKVITSGTAPTTTNTSKGDLAFGTVNGEPKLYGNTGTAVVELGGGGGSEVNSIAPLKVNTAPTTDADTVANVAVGELAKATIGDLSGLGEHNRTGVEALIEEMGGAGNTSIGCQATSTGLSCTAIGYGAIAGEGLHDNSVGSNPIGGGYGSIALGTTATASESASISIGMATESKSPAAIAIGANARASAANTTVEEGPVAIGARASATGTSSVAIGVKSKATQENEFSVGFSDRDASLTRRITHVTDPTDDQDAATKKYVDDKYTTLETTVAGKADTSALANYATKTELAAKADQTAVDAKVSSVTAGEGISITGTATEPVISATGGITDTGWLDVGSSGLNYLIGPFTIPSGSSLRIRKFGKRVTLAGTIQATEDINYTGFSNTFVQIRATDSNYSAFKPVAETAALSVSGTTETVTAFYLYSSSAGITAALCPVLGNVSDATPGIKNGEQISFQISWDTED